MPFFAQNRWVSEKVVQEIIRALADRRNGSAYHAKLQEILARFEREIRAKTIGQVRREYLDGDAQAATDLEDYARTVSEALCWDADDDPSVQELRSWMFELICRSCAIAEDDLPRLSTTNRFVLRSATMIDTRTSFGEDFIKLAMREFARSQPLRWDRLTYFEPVVGEIVSFEVPHVGWFKDLQNAVDKLSSKYGWSKAEATSFVLLGFRPSTHAISVRLVSSPIPVLTRIELSIDPRVTQKEVAKVYSWCRSKLDASSDKARASRPKDLRRLRRYAGRNSALSATLRQSESGRYVEHEFCRRIDIEKRDLKYHLGQLLRPAYHGLPAIKDLRDATLKRNRIQHEKRVAFVDAYLSASGLKHQDLVRLSRENLLSDDLWFEVAAAYQQVWRLPTLLDELAQALEEGDHAAIIRISESFPYLACMIIDDPFEAASKVLSDFTDTRYEDEDLGTSLLADVWSRLLTTSETT